MTLPLVILAILSLIGGWVGIPEALGGHNEFEHFLAPVFNAGVDIAANPQHFFMERVDRHRLPSRRALGAFIAWYFYCYKPGTAAALAAKYRRLYSLVDHKYWVDEIYGRFIVTPTPRRLAPAAQRPRRRRHHPGQPPPASPPPPAAAAG